MLVVRGRSILGCPKLDLGQDQLLQETIHSFMLGVSACETKDEIQQMFLSTAELLKKLKTMSLKLYGRNACFLMEVSARLVKKSITLKFTIFTCIFVLVLFYYNGLCQVERAASSSPGSEDSEESLDAYTGRSRHKAYGTHFYGYRGTSEGSV